MAPTLCFESSLHLMAFFLAHVCIFVHVSIYSSSVYCILILVWGMKCPVYHYFCPVTEFNVVKAT